MRVGAELLCIFPLIDRQGSRVIIKPTMINEEMKGALYPGGRNFDRLKAVPARNPAGVGSIPVRNVGVSAQWCAKESVTKRSDEDQRRIFRIFVTSPPEDIQVEAKGQGGFIWWKWHPETQKSFRLFSLVWEKCLLIGSPFGEVITAAVRNRHLLPSGLVPGIGFYWSWLVVTWPEPANPLLSFERGPLDCNFISEESTETGPLYWRLHVTSQSHLFNVQFIVFFTHRLRSVARHEMGGSHKFGVNFSTVTMITKLLLFLHYFLNFNKIYF